MGARRAIGIKDRGRVFIGGEEIDLSYRPFMKTVEMAEATAPLSEYARRVKDETVVTLRGKPVATLTA